MDEAILTGGPSASGPTLVTGANGRTGRAVVSALARAGRPVRAFARDAGQRAGLLALGAAEVAVGDLTDRASLGAALAGCAAAVHIGPPMHPLEVEITTAMIGAAEAAGVGHFTYYSVMHPVRREVRHHRLKLECEERLVASRLAWTIVQPARYMQHLAPIWPKVAADGVHRMPFGTRARFSVVDLEDLAEAVARVSGAPGHAFATYELAGPEALSQEDMADVISRVIGRPVRAEAIPLDEMAADAAAKGLSEDRIAQMRLMNAHYDAHGFRGNPNVLAMLLGRPPATYEAYVRRLAGR